MSVPFALYAVLPSMAGQTHPALLFEDSGFSLAVPAGDDRLHVLTATFLRDGFDVWRPGETTLPFAPGWQVKVQASHVELIRPSGQLAGTWDEAPPDWASMVASAGVCVVGCGPDLHLASRGLDGLLESLPSGSTVGAVVDAMTGE